MGRALEMPDSTFDALERVAEAGGSTPLQWIEARLAEVRTEAGDPPSSSPAETLADLFAGRVGRIRSGGAERLSERGGDDFAGHLEAKRREGHL